MSRGSDYYRAWDWGESSQEYVDKFLEDERDGTFLVFHTGDDIENLTLAIRVNGENKFVPIYHLDGLFGFTEPLNFKTLEDALDAYNWSPTETGNTLIYPGIKPGSSLHRTLSRSSYASLYEDEPLTLLKRLRQTQDLLRVQGVEYDTLHEEHNKLEEKVQELTNTLDSLNCLVKMMEGQIRKHGGVFNRSSISTKETSNAFSENYEKLITRLSDLNKEMRQVAEEKSVTEQEKSRVERSLAHSHAEIQQIVNDRIAIRSVLVSRNPDFEVFLVSLMDEDLQDYQNVEILTIDNSAAEKMLKSREYGTFLVRKNIRDPDKPYIISVRHTAKVFHFSVLLSEGCVGFDENTCIFENIHELVKHYSRVSFSVHDEKYGNLKLMEQLS